jgi:hypothetical protein
MGKSEQNQLREQRLAAKLRENLKRRKDQARARAQDTGPAPAPDAGPEAPETDTNKKP